MRIRLTSKVSRLAWARSTFLVFTTLTALGVGCGGGGGGCGGLGGGGTLPKEPGPWGFPMDQAVEGGMQVRITKPGFDKISSLIPELAKGALPSMANPQCIPKQMQSAKFIGTGGDFRECDAACGSKGATGCPVWVDLRPDLAPPGGISVSMMDNTTKAVVDIDAAFDVHMQLPIGYRVCVFGICGGWNNLCDLHVDGPGTHVKTAINLDIDPPTGKLVMSIADLTLPGLNFQTSNCGIASDFFNIALGFINGIAKSFIGNAIIGLLKPQLNKLIQGFLPDPPGLATIMSLSKTLASFSPPENANLEMLLVAGGYVSAKNGGLNLGMITGMNSDRDITTRDPMHTSDPALCVPIRPVIDVGAPPYNLPIQPMRNDHTLTVAGPFSGTPDPMDVMGKTQDLAIGISRTFLNLAGFHLYNSGGLCLSISGGILSSFNAGAVSILVPSLQNILDNKKAPLAISLRPEQPIVFTIGSGTATDPLLRAQVTDLRADFYAFIEERYVRLFTLALDLNVGINLAVTMGMDGKPAIAPMIVGLDKNNVQARVMNADLLQEDPKKLAKTLLSLIDVAVGQLGGGLKPIALPNLMGFSLDGLKIDRVQTPQEDFLAIFGSLKQNPNGMMWPLPRETVEYEREARPIETRAEILDVSVPPPDVIREAVQAGDMTAGNVPSVTLRLGTNTGTDAEYSYRIDGGMWHMWSSDPRPTVADAAFLLQARHTIEVRAREQGDWSTEDQTPERLEVLIDSAPPQCKLHVDRNSINFGGWDNVSEKEALRYSWKDAAQAQSENGGFTTPQSRDYLTFDEAWIASGKGAGPLVVRAYDEQGNHADFTLDLTAMNEFHGRMTVPAAAGGCGCGVGGAPSSSTPAATLLALFSLIGLLLRRRSPARA